MSVIAPAPLAPALSARIRDARVAGLLYLGLAVTGLLGFVVIAPGTSLDVVAELGIVATQALVALAFYKLFRTVDSYRAIALAAFGLLNAAVILVSAGALAAALGLTASSSTDLLLALSESMWLVGGLFFGFWLVPMGLLVLQSGWMPRALGWLLIVSGAGYVASTVATLLLPDAPLLADLLTFPATVGELWMIGYLLVRGVARPRAD